MNNPVPFRRPLVLYAGLLVLALAGLLAQRYATSWGGGVSPDSTQYVEGARSLLRGEGISSPDGAGTPTPITLWPPLVSLLLAAPGLLGVEPAEAGRWLTGLLFAANILLIGHVLARATRNSTRAAWAGAALMLLSPDLFAVHTWIWSEPAFIFFTLAGCAGLAAYLQQPSLRRSWLAGGTAGLAGLTRYAGAALGLAGIGLIFLFAGATSFRGRLGRAAGYGAVALGPLALWMIRNVLVAGSATTRQIGFHRLYSVHFLPAWETAARWILPNDTYSPLRAALLGLLLVCLLLGVARSVRTFRGQAAEASGSGLLPMCLAAFLACYGAFLFFSKFFVDPLFPLDDRILSPAQAAIVMLVVLVAHGELERAGRAEPSSLRRRMASTAQVLIVGLLAAQLGLGARQSAVWATMAHKEGLGFNSRSWQHSPLVAFVDQLPAEAVVHSNADDGLHYITERPVWQLPVPTGGTPRPDWVELILARSVGKRSYVVYFDAVTWRETVTLDDIRENFQFEKIIRPEEGSVLQISAME